MRHCRPGWRRQLAGKPRVAEYFFALGEDDRQSVESQQIDCPGFPGSRFRVARIITAIRHLWTYGVTLDPFDQAVCRSRGLTDSPEENTNDEVRLRAPLLKVSQTSNSNAEARRELRLTKASLFANQPEWGGHALRPGSGGANLLRLTRHRDQKLTPKRQRT